MPFTPLEIDALPLALSEPRFETYLGAVAGRDVLQALKLYEWNVQVAAAFMVPLQICEVTIRNGVSEALEKGHGPEWPWLKGFVRTLPHKGSGIYSPYDDLCAVAKKHDKDDRKVGKVVADLKFAFWESILTSGQDARIWSRYFYSTFPGAPMVRTFGDLRSEINNNLDLPG